MINGERVWMATVYRRRVRAYVDTENWERYEYATLFDILKEE